MSSRPDLYIEWTERLDCEVWRIGATQYYPTTGVEQGRPAKIIGLFYRLDLCSERSSRCCGGLLRRVLSETGQAHESTRLCVKALLQEKGVQGRMPDKTLPKTINMFSAHDIEKNCPEAEISFTIVKHYREVARKSIVD